ncbi:SO_0444 family Cu/Zn efflux transporter [Methanolobus sp. ZRKC3]|uniref:SO_0444 family Cu/Zn efflux transporter n=1 Tax=Methanolobus sp. ZRKC3 TaxID=3125786 RepID=UPI003247740E
MVQLSDIQTAIIGIAAESWYLFEEAAPYLFLGFTIAGILHIFVPDEQILKYLGRSAGKIRSALNATLMGIPIPLCSCGVIPAALSLKKRGATKGATLSFLISTPETGVDSIAITYALLDPIMTVFRPLATLVTALSAGITENFLDAREPPKPEKKDLLMVQPVSECIGSSCSCGATDLSELSMSRRLMEGMRYAYVELLGDISRWLIVGIIIAGIISYMIPASFINTYFGGGILSMFAMLLVGIPMYICATASTPLAAALIAKGMSPGTAFVFLLAGPATNAATITMVLKFLGKRTAILYLGMIALCSLLFGLLLDYIYFSLGIEASSIVGSASELMPQSVKTAFALLLIPLMAYGIYKEMK